RRLLVLGIRGRQRLAFLARFQRQLNVVRAGEHARQAVVIPRRNRVVLVVVAAGARDGQAQEAARHRVDAVVDLVELLGVAVVDRPRRAKAERRQVGDAVGQVHQVGGEPVRSKVTRRSSVRRSAGAAGCKPLASSPARRKRSMPVLAHSLCLTAGSAGWLSGWKDQNSRSLGVILKALAAARIGAVVSGQGAPCWIQSVSTAISVADSLPLGGILGPSSG